MTPPSAPSDHGAVTFPARLPSVGIRASPPDDPRRIAILRANNIGDFIVATPAFRALRHRYPGAEISVIAAPKVRPIFDRLPHLLDRFLEFPGFPGVWDRAMDPRRTVEFLRAAQADPFDLAIQAHGSGAGTNPFVGLLGARFTLGFIRNDDPPEVFGLDAALPYPTGIHERERVLRLLEVIGIPPAGRELELPFTEADRAEAARALAAAHVDLRRPIVAVHPAARFANRLWPAERFVAAARTLAAELDATVVVTGGPNDDPAVAAVAEGVGGANLARRLSIPALAALYARTALLLTNDSGPAHVAYAVGTPSVTIFGSASPVDWAPLDRSRHAVVEAADACHPCIAEPCIRRVPVEAVVAAAREVLATVRSSETVAPQTSLSDSGSAERPPAHRPPPAAPGRRGDTGRSPRPCGGARGARSGGASRTGCRGSAPTSSGRRTPG
jgi:ADP-heptose:LPS heptosyltransferase